MKMSHPIGCNCGGCYGSTTDPWREIEAERKAGDGQLHGLDGQDDAPRCPCGEPMIRSTGGWTCPDEFTAWILGEPFGKHDASGGILPNDQAMLPAPARKDSR